MLKLSRTIRHKLTGYVFVLPFIVGFLAFYLYPFILSIVISFSQLELGVGGYRLTPVGWENYRRALFVHENFVRVLVENLTSLLRDVPAIVMFSLFMATILNQKFRGRMVARVVFFLPVIFSSGAVQLMENFDYLTQSLQAGGAAAEGALGGGALMAVFSSLKLPETVLDYVMAAVQGSAKIIRSSGIQILVFMAGLQSIPESLYEASAIEGATPWESFWKITFPMISPLIPTTVLYTVIDSYASVDRTVMDIIRTTAFQGMGFGVSSAMAWVFFVLVSLILLVLIGIISRWVVYQE